MYDCKFKLLLRLRGFLRYHLRGSFVGDEGWVEPHDKRSVSPVYTYIPKFEVKNA